MTERRNPRDFPIDDRRVYDAYIAGRMSAALAAGVRCGLFELLNEGPLSESEIARRLGFRERPTRSFLAALVATGLVRREASAPSVAPPPTASPAASSLPPRFSLADDAAAYLVRGKPGWLGGLIDLEVEGFLSPATLLDAMRRGTANVYGDEDPWKKHEADPEAARRFTRAMHSISERPAAGLAEVAPLEHARRLLDVGGGSGALSLALARRFPQLQCVIYDLAVVCDLAREYARDAGFEGRVLAEPGDMFGESLPAGYDAILYSQILHDWPFEKGAALLSKAAAALPPGGLVLVHEKLVDDDGSGPLANALVHLDMLVWTEGQQYSEAELRRHLGAAGFVDIEHRATAGYWSLMIGRKPLPPA